MKRKLLLLALLALSLSAVQAQTKLKWNALYWAMGVVNMSAETKLADKWTFNGDAVYSPWKSIEGNPMRFGQLIVEGRYYPKGAFNGLYVGGYQKGNGMSFGATLGYQIKINDRWAVDLFASYGWQHSRYKGYIKSTGEMYVGKNASAEWLPYKLGASFVYRLVK